MTVRPGFFIAIESFEVANPPLRLFAEHLVSNIAAHIALSGLTPVPVVLLRKDHREARPEDAVNDFPPVEDAVELTFDPMDGFVTPRLQVETALSGGAIVVADRFLHHMDGALSGGHVSLPVEELLFSGELQADCVIYITRPEDDDSRSALASHAHATLIDMGERRGNVHVVTLTDPHTDVCDEVWHKVQECLAPWLEAQKSTAVS